MRWLGSESDMSGRPRKLITLGVVLLVVGALSFGIWKWVTRDKPSYESRFAEYIWIEYPAGQMLESGTFGGNAMDQLLREREVGYLGGVTSRGDPPEVVEVREHEDFIERRTVRPLPSSPGVA